MIRTQIVEDLAALEALVPAWRNLAAHAPAASPFSTPTWLLAWWRQFGAADGRRLRTVAFFDGAELVGLAPLATRTVLVRGLVPVRRLELLGTGEDEADEICSEYVGVLAGAAHVEAVAVELAGLVARGALGGFDELIMPAMGEADPLVAALRGALERAGMHPVMRVQGTCQMIGLPATWKAYLAALGSRHRYLVQRSLRDLDQVAGERGHELRRAAAPADLAEGVGVLRDLHGARWQADDAAGAFASNRFARFHDEVMRAFLGGADARLDLLWLVAAGEPIAALYNIVHRGRVFFYQSGRRPDLPNLRPGIAIHALAIRRAIEEGLVEYDFLAGDAQYKRQLALGSRNLVELRAIGPGVRAMATDAGLRYASRVAGRLRRARAASLAAARELAARVKSATGR